MKLLLKSVLFALISLFVIGCGENGDVSALRYGKNLISVDSTILGMGTVNDPFRINPDSVATFAADSAEDVATNTYRAILLGANGSLTSTTVARNDLSDAPVVAYSAEGVYTVTLADEFTANKTTVFLTLGSGTGGVVLKGVRTSANVVTINSFLVTDGTTAADFIGTVNLEINVEP